MNSVSRILVVDAQTVCREGMAALAARRFPAAQVTQATTFEAGLPLLADNPSDLVLADISVATTGARSIADLVAAAHPGQVLAVDSRPDARRTQQARSAGARGYLVKSASADLIDAALGLVAAGGECFPSPTSVDQAFPSDRLSARQAEVLEGLMRGKSNKQIADALGISVATVKLHVHAVLSATGAQNRTEAALLALGLLARSDDLPVDSPCLHCPWLRSREPTPEPLA